MFLGELKTKIKSPHIGIISENKPMPEKRENNFIPLGNLKFWLLSVH